MIHTIETFENNTLLMLSCGGNEQFTAGIHGNALRITSYSAGLALHHGTLFVITMWVRLGSGGVLSFGIDDIDITIDANGIMIDGVNAEYNFGSMWRFVVIKVDKTNITLAINDEIVAIAKTNHTSDYRSITMSNAGGANTYVDIDDFVVTSDIVARSVSSFAMFRIEKNWYSSTSGGDEVSAISDFDDTTYVEIIGNSGESKTCLYSARVTTSEHNTIKEIAIAHRSKGDGSVRVGLSDGLEQTGKRKHLSQQFAWYIDSTKKMATGDNIDISDSAMLLVGVQYIFD